MSIHGIDLIDNKGRQIATVPMQSRFDSRLKWLAAKGVPFHIQKQLPVVGYAGIVEAAMELVLSKGGEGLVLKKNDGLYETCRSCWMLKYKPFSDDEGLVVGTTPGLGRLAGMIGALVINWKGRQFELAGLTDVERSLEPAKWIGRTVTFKYRCLTRDGLPSEARYWRDRGQGD
jgi:DNA ligase-1